MRTLLFHNPNAGDGKHAKKGLMATLRKAGLSVTYCSTKGEDFPEVIEESADLFVVAGGDGTVGKVLKRMPDRSIPVAILPLGTANNIARSLGVFGKPKKVIAGLEKARKQPFDIGLAHGPWGKKHFVEAVGLGSLTEAMARVDSIDIERGDGLKLGRDTFRRILSEAKPIRLGMCIDGRDIDQECLLAEVLNIPYAGPGIALAPQGGLGDGVFDIAFIAPDQRADMLAWLGAEKPNIPAPLTTRQGRTISLSWEGSQLRLDDDCPSAARRGERITIEIERESVTILVPEANEDKTKRGDRSERSRP